MKEKPRICPSAPANVGSVLFATRTPDGSHEHLVTPFVIDAELIAQINNKGTPEKLARFADVCGEARCSRWQNGGCQVVREVTAKVITGALPKCAIRAGCRWFHQEGVAACSACRLITTDVS